MFHVHTALLHNDTSCRPLQNVARWLKCVMRDVPAARLRVWWWRRQGHAQLVFQGRTFSPFGWALVPLGYFVLLLYFTWHIQALLYNTDNGLSRAIAVCLYSLCVVWLKHFCCARSCVYLPNYLSRHEPVVTNATAKCHAPNFDCATSSKCYWHHHHQVKKLVWSPVTW